MARDNLLRQNMHNSELTARLLDWCRSFACIRDHERLCDTVMALAGNISGISEGALYIQKEGTLKIERAAAIGSTPAPEGLENLARTIVIGDSGGGSNSCSSIHNPTVTAPVIAIAFGTNSMVRGVCFLIHDPDSADFNDETRLILENLLDHAALAMENLILHGRLVERERKSRRAQGPDSRVNKIISFLEENHIRPVGREEVASMEGLSSDYLGKLFKVVTGMTINDYINGIRIRKSKEMLKQPELCIREIARAVGFNSVRSYFRVFQRLTGMTPAEFRGRKDRYDGPSYRI